MHKELTQATLFLQEIVQKSWNQFGGKYDNIDHWITHKIRHTYWVFAIWNRIISNDNFLINKKDLHIDLNLVCILHDIARFFEFTPDGKMISRDNNYYDHGNVWYNILKDSIWTDNTPLLLSVKYHNKMKFEYLFEDSIYQKLNNSDKEKTQTILRFIIDADRLENIENMIYDDFISTNCFNDIENTKNQNQISKQTMEQYISGKIVEKKYMNTIAENYIWLLSWKFDLYFEWSKKIYKQSNFDDFIKNKLKLIWVDDSIISDIGI